MRSWLVWLALAGCSRGSDEGSAHQWQDNPPPHAVVVPDGISIEVRIDGSAATTITTDTLRAATPDFADPERRAWRIAKLVADPAGDAAVEVTAPTGLTLKFPRSPHALEPVLYLTRRGEVVAAAVDPKDPFPDYHGRGGRLHRAGDSIPRLSPVSRLDLTHAAPPSRAVP